MQAFGLLLAIVGLLLVLLLFGVRVKTSWLDLDWHDKPPRRAVWPLAACLLAGGLWLAFAVERSAPIADPSVNEASLSDPAEAGNMLADSNTASAAPISAGDEPRPVVREKISGPRALPAAPAPTLQPPPGRTATADNGSVAVAGDIIGSTVSANGDGNRSGQQP